MQKKLIAVAVAGLMSGAALAQSNVTVYGVVDAFYGNFKATGTSQKVNAINGGGLAGSRLGFRGTEDLGNGLSAIFTLEYSLSNDTNTGIAAARQQFVGLRGAFGTAVAGRLQSPGFAASGKYDAHAASVLSPLGQITDVNDMSISARDANARFNNAIAYVTPSFNGLTGTVAYSFIGEQNTAPRSTGWTMSADYNNGPLSVNFTHNNLKLATAAANQGTTVASWTAAGAACAANTATIVANVSTSAGLIQGCSSASAAAFTDTQKENALFGSYDFGVVKLFGAWQSKKTDRDGNAGLQNNSRVWNLGASMPVGAGAVRFSYAKLNDKMAANNDGNAWGLAYTHSLSKRTTAYTGYTAVSFKNAALTVNGVTPQASGKSKHFGVGLNHSF